jgi:hypothetical protein
MTWLIIGKIKYGKIPCFQITNGVDTIKLVSESRFPNKQIGDTFEAELSTKLFEVN